MKILYMGTPDIAAGCLKTLINEGFDVCAVVTQPDKPKGRGHKMLPPDVKVCAMEYNLDCYQPVSLKNGELLPVLEEYKPDVIIVVAYGKILPEYVLDYPKYGCINMHASKLPKYRGAAPIQWAIINGDTTTAATAMKMDRGLDTGDILLEEELIIGEYETSGELFERMTEAGGRVLCNVLKNIDSITPIPQSGEAVYAPMITKETAHINWHTDSKSICKFICGMNPAPLAYTYYNGEAVKIVSARPDADIPGTPGEILDVSPCGIKVKTGDGCIIIDTVRFPGKKTMAVSDYIKGNKIDVGVILE